jgi:hypothetical protein
MITTFSIWSKAHSKTPYLNGEQIYELDHFNYTFVNIQQAFYKHYQKEKIDKHIYMKLWNLKQQNNGLINRRILQESFAFGKPIANQGC